MPPHDISSEHTAQEMKNKIKKKKPQNNYIWSNALQEASGMLDYALVFTQVQNRWGIIMACH